MNPSDAKAWLLAVISTALLDVAEAKCQRATTESDAIYLAKFLSDRDIDGVIFTPLARSQVDGEAGFCVVAEHETLGELAYLTL